MEGKTTIYECKTCGHEFSFVEKEGVSPVCEQCGEKEEFERVAQQG